MKIDMRKRLSKAMYARDVGVPPPWAEADYENEDDGTMVIDGLRYYSDCGCWYPDLSAPGWDFVFLQGIFKVLKIRGSGTQDIPCYVNLASAADHSVRSWNECVAEAFVFIHERTEQELGG